MIRKTKNIMNQIPKQKIDSSLLQWKHNLYQLCQADMFVLVSKNFNKTNTKKDFFIKNQMDEIFLLFLHLQFRLADNHTACLRFAN